MEPLLKVAQQMWGRQRTALSCPLSPERSCPLGQQGHQSHKHPTVVHLWALEGHAGAGSPVPSGQPPGQPKSRQHRYHLTLPPPLPISPRKRWLPEAGRAEAVLMEPATGQLALWRVVTPRTLSHRTEQGHTHLEAGGLAPGPPPATWLTGRRGCEPSCKLSGATENLFQFFRL